MAGDLTKHTISRNRLYTGCHVTRCCMAMQVYPKMFLRGGTMYDTTWWAWLVTVWEVVVYNSVLDLQQCWQV